MNNKKMVITCLLALGFSAYAAIAGASFTIVNNTNQSSTSIINKGPCSAKITKLVKEGQAITPPHSTLVVTDANVTLACLGNPKNCSAEVYMSDNCQLGSAVVAVVTFDTSTGIKNVENKNVNGYVVTGSGFQATINGGN